MSFFTLKLSKENKKIENFPKFQRQMEKKELEKDSDLNLRDIESCSLEFAV